MKSILKVKCICLLPLLLLLINEVSGQDFEVAPVVLEYSAEPGENQTKIITVKNHSNLKASFIISLSDFLPTSKGEKQIMSPNSTKRSCANWLNINPSFFELNPGDEIPIQIGIMVPSDQYSASWCMLYIQPSREQTAWSVDKKIGTGILVSGKIGVVIYQTPKSNANNSLKVSNMVEITKIGDRQRVFNATIENLGDRITKCKVSLVASNIRTADELLFKPVELETFPKMSRTIELVLPNELKPGSYSLATIVDYGAKYSLEGTQIIIEVKDQPSIAKPDTSVIKKDIIKPDNSKIE